jgi:hypothetical protein
VDLRYTPEMLEEAVAIEALRRDASGDGAWIRDFHLVTDPYYKLPEAERDTRFREANALFFQHLGLSRPLEAAAREAAALGPLVDELVLDRATTATEEEGDLFGREGAKPSARIRVRVKRFEDLAALEGFFRHELRHLDDMMRPAFGYRAQARLAVRPAEENLVRARLRLLWNLTVAGAIARSGKRGAATREEWAAMTAKNYPGFTREAREKVLARLWDSGDATWEQLMDLALNPKKLLRYAGVPGDESPRGPGALCPMCSFPTFDWYPDPGALPEAALSTIHADFPLWTASEGACRQCTDSYVLRSRFAPKRAVHTP